MALYDSVADRAIQNMALAQAAANEGNAAAAQAYMANATNATTKPTATQQLTADVMAHQAQINAQLKALGGQDDSSGSVAQTQTTAEDADRTSRIASAYASVAGQFRAWGLDSLNGLIRQYAEQDLSTEAMVWKLRESPEYAARFPAMAQLGAKGRGITEAEYINYEQQSSQLENRFGLPKGMILNNVTNLLVGEVSLIELQDRATLAASDSITAPDDLKNMMKEYYGIDAGGLTAYYLDPKTSLPLLEQQAATSRIGVEAARQKVSADLAMASELQGQGVTQEQAKQGFGVVAGAGALTAGKGETTSTKGLTRGVFGNADEAAKSQRIASSRTGRFQGGGGFVDGEKGVGGLAGANT